MGGGVVGSRGIRFDLTWSSFALLIGVTVLFELTLAWLQHRTVHYVSKMLLHKVMEELMILGFISFALVFCNEYDLIPDESYFHALEFAHILLFYGVCGLVPRAFLMQRTLRRELQNMNSLAATAPEETARVLTDRPPTGSGFGRICAKIVSSASPENDLGWQLMRIHVPQKLQ